MVQVNFSFTLLTCWFDCFGLYKSCLGSWLTDCGRNLSDFGRKSYRSRLDLLLLVVNLKLQLQVASFHSEPKANELRPDLQWILRQSMLPDPPPFMKCSTWSPTLMSISSLHQSIPLEHSISVFHQCISVQFVHGYSFTTRQPLLLHCHKDMSTNYKPR